MATDRGTEHQEGREMSDQELAQAYLTRELEETNRQLAENQRSNKFHRSYKPAHPGLSPHSDAGGDIADWEVARLEYEQWPEEREEMLDHLEAEQEALQDKNSDLHDLRERMENGDTTAIALAAGRERARLEAIKERASIQAERNAGVTFEGIDEVVDNIAELHRLNSEGAFQGKPNGGWTTGQYSNQDGGYPYYLKPGEGPLGSYVASISIRKGEWPTGTADDTVIRYRDFSSAHNKGDKGLYLGFKINGSVVKDHSSYEITPRHQFGNHGPVKMQVDGLDKRMTQQHFDKFRSHLGSLVQAGRGPSRP